MKKAIFLFLICICFSFSSCVTVDELDDSYSLKPFWGSLDDEKREETEED